VKRHDYQLGYTVTRLTLQGAGLAANAKRRGGTRRKKRARRPLPGMLLFQDGSTHRWIGALDRDLDLIVTLDDAGHRRARLSDDRLGFEGVIADPRGPAIRPLVVTPLANRPAQISVVPVAATKASSDTAAPEGRAASERAQGRKAPLPRGAASLPSATTMRPRLSTVTGQPCRWRPS
jgi:hypothetical protein